MLEPNVRQYWLWVTRPEYYLDDDGNDSESLDPENNTDSDGWWTCNKETKEGDFVFLWRTTPKKDIGYLIQTESDAYSIADENDQGWDYACDYQVLYKFNHPIQVKDLRNNPYFDEWGPLRCSFQRRSFRISLEYWNKLNQLAAANNPGYLEFIESIQKIPIAEGIRLEEELEDELVNNLKILKNFGHDLNLYFDSNLNQSGRQLICKGNGGRIDLLCYDKNQNRYVVIELKNVRAGQNTFGQISNYMGWVQDRIAKGIPVSGLVISRGYDTRFESALKITDRISQINVEDLGFSIVPSKKTQTFNGINESEISKAKDKSNFGTRSAKSREAGAWLKKGDAFFDQEKYEEAISCYDKAVEIDYRNKWGWINKGVALAELAKFEEAISCCDKTIEMYPRSTHAWIYKGSILNEMRKFEEAILTFSKAIEMKPKSSDAWIGKGFALAEMKKYDESIQCCEEAIKSNPKNVIAWNNKGFTLMDLGKYAEAVQSFEKQIKLDLKSASAWSNKGTALYGLHMYEDALEAFNKAIEIDAHEAIYWSFKSDALKSLNRIEEADAAFAKVKELGYKGSLSSTSAK